MQFAQEASRVDSPERFVRLRTTHPEPDFEPPIVDGVVDTLNKLTAFDIQVSKREARTPMWSMKIFERLLRNSFGVELNYVQASLIRLLKTWLQLSERELRRDTNLWWETMHTFFPLLAIAASKTVQLADSIVVSLSGDIFSLLLHVSPDRAHAMWECFNSCIHYSTNDAKFEACLENRHKVNGVRTLMTESEEVVTQISLLKNLMLWLNVNNKTKQMEIIFPSEKNSTFQKALSALSMENFHELAHDFISKLNVYSSIIISSTCVTAHWNDAELCRTGEKIWTDFSIETKTLTIHSTGKESLEYEWKITKMYFDDIEKSFFSKKNDLWVLTLKTTIRMSDSLSFARYDTMRGKLDLSFTEQSFRHLYNSPVPQFIFHKNLNEHSDSDRKMSKAVLTIKQNEENIKKSIHKVSHKNRISTAKIVIRKVQPEKNIKSIIKSKNNESISSENNSNISSILRENDKALLPMRKVRVRERRNKLKVKLKEPHQKTVDKNHTTDDREKGKIESIQVKEHVSQNRDAEAETVHISEFNMHPLNKESESKSFEELNENDLNNSVQENLKRYLERYYEENIERSKKRLKRLNKQTTDSDNSDLQPLISHINDLIQFSIHNNQETKSFLKICQRLLHSSRK